MDFTLHVWRQAGADKKGHLETYRAKNISPDMSFIEMLNTVNADLSGKQVEPIAYDCDCLEGICGTCSLVINGVAHGPESGTTTCQLHMRSFKDGASITIEPWRAKAFPIIKDLVVDRSAFDRIIQAGGYISINTGGAPDANALPVPKKISDKAMDAAQCIGCGACVSLKEKKESSIWLSKWTKKASVIAQTNLSAKPFVQKKSALSSLPK